MIFQYIHVGSYILHKHVLIFFHSVIPKDKKLPAGGAQCQRNQISEIELFFNLMF